MNRYRAALLATMLVLIPVLAAPPASAGGPTSVLLVSQETGRSASLHHSDDRYDMLLGLLEGADVSRDDAEAEETVDRPTISATWLIHDVTPWRLDRIYLDAQNRPWISTRIAAGGSDVWTGRISSHPANDGRRLFALLDQLGLDTSALYADRSESSSGTRSASRSAPPGLPRNALAPSRVTSERGSQNLPRPADTGLPFLRGWPWVVGSASIGLLLGLALAWVTPLPRRAASSG